MRSITSFLLIFFCSAASAQDSIYDRCLAAMDADNSSLVAELAATMKRFTTHPVRQWENAAQCVSAAEGKNLGFDSASGSFVDAEILELRRQKTREEYQEQRRTQEDRRLAREARQREAARQQQLNEAFIVEGIYTSCTTLFERDQVLAMTNALCIQSFRTNGHPLLDLTLDK